MNDPFAPTADEAQTETPAEAPADSPFDTPPAEAPKKTAAKKAAPKAAAKTTVSTDSEGKVTVTLKGGAGFDAPWIVIHAESIEDAYAQMTESGTLLGELMKRVSNAGQYFAGLAPAKAGPAGGGNRGAGNANGGNQRQGQPQGSQEAPNGEKRYCAHGEMRFKSDVSKAGKPYKGFFCTSRDRNDQCDAEFLRG
jgi:hypothetical protein